MDTQDLLDAAGETSHPVGLTGCRRRGDSYDCCEYDITIFDGDRPDDIVADDPPVLVHHGSLDEQDPARLVHYSDIRILRDESWDLRAMADRIRRNKKGIFSSHAGSMIVEALMCISRAETGDVFAPCWTKAAAFALADAMLLLDMRAPSPAHGLQALRSLGRGETSRRMAEITGCMGIERASESLLRRMMSSTVGFSDLVHGPVYSGLIEAKCEYMMGQSMTADCYFYLGSINSGNLMQASQIARRNPDTIHILKVALDIEGGVAQSQTGLLREAAGRMLAASQARAAQA